MYQGELFQYSNLLFSREPVRLHIHINIHCMFYSLLPTIGLCKGYKEHNTQAPGHKYQFSNHLNFLKAPRKYVKKAPEPDEGGVCLIEFS